MRVLASTLLAAASLTGCVLPGPGISPHGRPTVAHTRAYRLEGELVAISADTLWIISRRDSLLRAVRMDSLLRVDVQRHPFGARKTFKVAGYIGLGTGLLLTLACSQVEDASCGVVIPVITGVALIPGALFALINYESSWIHLDRPELSRARPYARFPQGLPDTLRATTRATASP